MPMACQDEETSLSDHHVITFREERITLSKHFQMVVGVPRQRDDIFILLPQTIPTYDLEGHIQICLPLSHLLDFILDKSIYTYTKKCARPVGLIAYP